MSDASRSDESLADLVGHTEEAASAWMRGDMDRYLALTHHARGFTLMDPSGGPARRSDWLLVHRHADPLVHTIDMQQMAALAQGDELPVSAAAQES